MATSVESARRSPPAPVDNQGYDSTTVALIAAGAVAVTVMVAIVAVELFYLIKESMSEWLDGRTIDDLKKKVKAHLPEKLAHLIEIADTIGDVSAKTLLRRMELTHDDEKQFLLYIIEHYDVSADDLKEILRGAHVRLDDGGAAFRKWEAELQLKKERISSHPSNAKQYGMQGSLIRELLFSQIEDNTWFQLEKNPTGLGHVLRHAYNYACYKIRNTNQGPCGESYFKDSNPLVLRKRQSSV